MSGTPPFQWSESDLREVEANYREEVSSQWMYSQLAQRDKVPERAQMFRTLAEYEERHARLWEGVLRSTGRPVPRVHPLVNHRILVRMGRILGPGSVVSIIHREEVDGVAKYRDQARRWTTPVAEAAFRVLLPDEIAHEIETFHSASAAGPPGGGSLRSILLGAIDGFASIVALAAGVAAITHADRLVLIAGSASLVAGALSMAASEYVSVKAETEARAAQVTMERQAMEAAPETKRRQLSDAYVEKGLTREEADQVVGRLSQKPDQFFRTLLAERSGITGSDEEHPARQGVLTGISFALAGGLPLIPYLLLPAHIAVLVSVLLTGGVLFLAGLFRALSSLQPFVRSGVEMLLIGMGSAAGTFLIGLVIGGAVGG